MKVLRNPMSILMILLVLAGPGFINTTAILAAEAGKKIVHWTNYGGDPRRPGKPGGVHSKEEFRTWFLSEAGQNDVRASGLPPKIQALMTKVVQGNQWGMRVTLGQGMTGSLQEHVHVPYGTMYDHLSWGVWGQNSHDNVRVEFSDGYVFRVAVVDLWGGYWKFDDFERCANAGSRAVVSYTPPAKPPEYVPYPGAKPVVVPQTVYTVWYYDMSPMPKWEYKTATLEHMDVHGMLPYVLGFLGEIYRAVPRISVTQNAGSPSFQGGPVTANGGAGGNSTNTNMNAATNTTTTTTGVVIGGGGATTGTFNGAGNSTTTQGVKP